MTSFTKPCRIVASFCFAAVIFFSTGSHSVAGPIFPTRGILLAPKWYEKTDTNSTLDHAGFWATIARGIGSDEDRFGWSVTTGAVIEFARWSGTSSLFAFGGMELVSDTRNDISFNPRGAFWEEGVMFARTTPKFDWELGLVYRCRHDVDNGDTRETIGALEQRTLIYGSLSSKIISGPTDILNLHTHTTGWLRGDAYLFREDDRLPINSQGSSTTDFNKLAWTIGGGAKTHLLNLGDNFLYAEAEVNFSAFGKSAGFISRYTEIGTIATDLYGEVGYETSGRVGRLQLFINGTSFTDDGSTPVARNSQFIGLGIHLTAVDFSR